MVTYVGLLCPWELGQSIVQILFDIQLDIWLTYMAYIPLSIGT